PDPSAPAAEVSGTAPAEKPGYTKEVNPPEKPRDWKWADLIRRVFDLDVLACPRCGGRMSVIATIEAADVLRKILGHLGLPIDPPAPLSALPPPPQPARRPAIPSRPPSSAPPRPDPPAPLSARPPPSLPDLLPDIPA